MGFKFHGELFEERGRASEALTANGFDWISDYGSIEVDHHLYGIRVCGIGTEESARAIRSVLRSAFPSWRFVRTHMRDSGIEPGWRVLIHRDREPRSIGPRAPAGPKHWRIKVAGAIGLMVIAALLALRGDLAEAGACLVIAIVWASFAVPGPRRGD